MESNYDPIWDERGELRRGCTVREALAWLTNHGSHSAGESVYINGVGYRLGPNRPEIADKPISRIYDGYYRQLNFSV